MTKTNSQIREEIINKLQNEWGVDNRESDSFDNWVADLLLSKIDELLKSQREEMIGRIEKMIKVVNYQLGGFFIEEESYNEAIKDILYLIKNN